ncbi:serine/threonine-protein kinase BRI1-like 2 [Salvia miltiorrhiza]|uniref:serine/threonine-protein kinase BRI1-like 2 n=1 Tax=Salvia miltiorrhiza TaxID=226208 RepID=UPI0025AD7312|nr:serine/threonine-protein kinase BRI1-like 2 [Salvia miltiorrhiza]
MEQGCIVREITAATSRNAYPCTFHCVTCNDQRRVTALDLAISNLVGQIFSSPFSSLDILISLNLSAKSFVVNANSSLLQIPYTVKELELSFSGIIGHIPEKMFTNCPNLEYVNLAFNNITGFLPENLLLHIDKLKYLDFSYNNISGMISDLKIERCSSLSHLDWSGNQIAGSLPPSSEADYAAEFCLRRNPLRFRRAEKPANPRPHPQPPHRLDPIGARQHVCLPLSTSSS